MRDNITTIPLTEIFEINEGCPVCRLRDTVEGRIIDFVMGGAMMEPDVRIKTNEQGFCHQHFGQMLGRQNKLSVALILESHLAEIDKRLFQKASLPLSKEGYHKNFKEAGKIAGSCYVCARIDWAMDRLFDTLVHTYVQEGAFRALFDAQPFLCLPHYSEVATAAQKGLKKGDFERVNAAAAALCRRGLEQLRTDISWFCQKHDYQNSDKPWGDTKDAPARAVKYLTSL